MEIDNNELANVFKMIKKYFQLDQSMFIYQDVKHQSFGNWIVVVQLEEYRIKIYRDRGEVFMAIGPLDANLGWHGGPWVDIEVIIAYITDFKVIIGKYQGEMREVERQVEHLSNLFWQYHKKINDIFSNNGFQQHQHGLELAHNQIVDKYIHNALNK